MTLQELQDKHIRLNSHEIEDIRNYAKKVAATAVRLHSEIPSEYACVYAALGINETYEDPQQLSLFPKQENADKI